MRKLSIIFMLAVVSALSSFGQLSGPKIIGSGGDFPTLTAAIAALNTQGVGTGGVTFNIPAGYTETFTDRLNGTIYTNTSTVDKPIIFQKSGEGVNPKITAPPGSTLNADYIICIGGTDYITFDGIDLQENPANLNPTTQMEWGFAVLRAFVSAGVYDGSQHVTIRNCSISLTRTYTSTVGIYSFRSLYTAPQTAITVTNPEGANSYNSFYNNTITNVNAGMYFYGSVNAAAYDLNNQIGTSAGGNTITNYGAATGTATGIYVQYNTNLTVANNNINGSVPTPTCYGMNFQSTTNATVDISGNTISIQFAPAAGTGGFYAINDAMGTSSTTNTISIHDNLITGCTYANATTGTLYYMNIGHGGPDVRIYNNTISNNTLTRNSNSSSTTYYFYNNAFPSTKGTGNYYGNSISNNTYTQNGSGAATTYFMYVSLQCNTLNCYNNVVDNNTANVSGTIYGIYCNPTQTLQKNIYGNSVTNLTGNTNTSPIYGLYISGGTSSNYDIHHNKIQNITNNTGTSTQAISGLYLGSGNSAGNINVYNNVIGDLKAPNSNSTIAIYGIYMFPYMVTSVGLYNNTIYLNASSGAANFGTYGIYLPKIGTSVYSLSLRNNIVDNISTPNGTGKTVVLLTDTLNFPFLASTSNNNCLFAGTPSGSRLIYSDGTNNDQTITAYKARFNPRENSSLSENPPFIASTTPVNLHISSTTPTQCESGGATVSTPVSVTTDYDNDARYPNSGYPNDVNYPATAPDIGADEFGGRPFDTMAPLIVYSPLLNTSVTTGRTLIATITDPRGVPVSGIGLPRISWKKNYNGAWTFVQANSNGNSQYAFTFGNGVSVGDTVYYFVVAQDNYLPANVGSVPNTGASGFSANPPSVVTPPSNAYSYVIIPSICGTFTVGVGQHYPTLSAAISDINGKEITCPTTLLLTDAEYSSSETFPITLNANLGSNPTNTLTIKPNTEASPFIHGSSASGILTINGFDYLVIDGSNSGGTDRNLTIQNTNAANNAYTLGLSLAGASDPATHITIMNSNIKAASSNTFMTRAIYLNSVGGGYDNVVIQNNSITSAYRAIEFNGTLGNSNHNGQIINNFIGSYDTLQYVYYQGIFLQNSDNTLIEGNEIIGAVRGDSLTPSPAGIFMFTGSTNTKIRKNKIHDWYWNGNFGSPGTGVSGIWFEAENTTVTEISNNLIYNLMAVGASPGASPNNPYGIYILTGGNIKILHNSIHLSGNCLGLLDYHDGSSACIGTYYSEQVNNIEVRDNILQNSMKGLHGYCALDGGAYAFLTNSSNTSCFSIIDNNDYYVDACLTAIAQLSTTRIYSLAQWRITTGQDANSTSENPMFASSTDFHPGNPAIYKTGAYVSLVPTDIAGTAHTNPPDPGAYQMSSTQSVVTLPATSLTATDAVLNGMIAPKGNVVITGFEYGLTTLYGMSVVGIPASVAGQVPLNDSAAISGLTPGTEYNFRAIGTSGGAMIYGDNVTFTTPGLSKTLNLTVLLEGIYNPGTSLLNKVQDCTDGATSFDKFGGSITDTLTVLLANPTDPWAFVYKAFGVPVSTDGSISLNVPGTYAGNFYIVIRHRFSVETWSAAPVSFAGSAITYDFTTAASQAFGNNLKNVEPESNKWSLYSGDFTSISDTQDGYIDIFDNNAVFNNAQNALYGYLPEDVNGDGFVDIFDMVIVFNNMQTGAGMITPPNPGKK